MGPERQPRVALLLAFALAAAFAGFIAYFETQDVRYVFGALIAVSSWPYAFFVMAPLNNQILGATGQRHRRGARPGAPVGLRRDGLRRDRRALGRHVSVDSVNDRSFRLRDVADALRFFTRLPLPTPPDADFDFNRFAWAAPVAGAAVGLVGVAALGTARSLALPPPVAASLAVAALVAASGALHEDGLADVADGFGGGATRERKLAIMRDSRIGAFGAVALALSLILRVGAVSAALGQGFLAAAGALVLAAAASRRAPCCRSRCSIRRGPTARA